MTYRFNPVSISDTYDFLDYGKDFSRSNVIDAYFEDALATNPLEQLTRAYKELPEARGQELPARTLHSKKRFNKGLDNTINIIENRLSVDEQINIIKNNNLEKHLTPVKDETTEGLQLRIKWKQEELARMSIMSNSDNTFLTTMGGFGAGLVASFLDPINLGMGFAPIVGPAKYAKQLQEAGSKAAKFSVRLRTGAVEGAVGAGIVEVPLHMATTETQYDYDLYDSFFNMAFGAIIGGTLRSGGGYVKDIFTQRIETAINKVGEDTRIIVFRTALGQALAGRSIQGADVILRMELEKGGNVRKSGDPNSKVINTNDPRDLNSNDPVYGKVLEVRAGDENNFQISFKTKTQAAKQVKRFTKDGLKASIITLGRDDHRVQLEIPNNFIKGNDNEYIIFNTIKQAQDYIKDITKLPSKIKDKKSGVSVKIKPKTEEAVIVKINNEFLIYKADKTSPASKGIVNSLRASADDLQMPLEVPVIKFIEDPEIKGLSVIEHVSNAVKTTNSDKNLMHYDIEQEATVQANELLDNLKDFDNLESRTVEMENLEIDEMLNHNKKLMDEIGEENLNKFKTMVTEIKEDALELQKIEKEIKNTENKKAAYLQAVVCINGS